MKKKKKEITAIAIGVAILLAGLWVLFFLRPRIETISEYGERTAALIEDNRVRREAIQARHTRYAQLGYDLTDVRAEWEVAAADLPTTFDSATVLRHVQHVLYPHTGEIELNFGVSTQREYDLLYSTTVELTFVTTYWQFLAVLNNLVNPDDVLWALLFEDGDRLGNRVVNYELSVEPIEEGDYLDLLLGDRDNYGILGHWSFGEMPPHIRDVLQSDYANRDEINPAGLQMFEVTMIVEYLTLEPGLFEEADLRAIWAIEDATPEPEPENQPES